MPTYSYNPHQECGIQNGKNASTVMQQKAIEKEAIPILGLDSERIQEYLKLMGVCLDDFQTWIDFTHVIRRLMENGVINFDEIKESDLNGLSNFRS